MLGLVFVVSLMLEIIPGDPVLLMLSETASREMKEAVRHQLGLDKPFMQRYFNYLGKIMQGDLGRSFLKGQKVAKLVGNAFPATAELAAASLFVMMLVGLPIGVLSALFPQSKVDFFAQMISLIGVSMPAFWIGLLLIYAFAYRLGLFPLGGRSGVTSLILPACSLSISSVGFLMRIVRVSMLEVMSKEFITTARSKGLSEATVVWKHGLRNATIPIITVLGLQFGRLLGGAVVTEVVFSWPGMGRLIVEGILDRDYPLVQGAILVFGFVFVVINLLIDISYSIVDPRVRYD